MKFVAEALTNATSFTNSRARRPITFRQPTVRHRRHKNSVSSLTLKSRYLVLIFSPLCAINRTGANRRGYYLLFFFEDGPGTASMAMEAPFNPTAEAVRLIFPRAARVLTIA